MYNAEKNKIHLLKNIMAGFKGKIDLLIKLYKLNFLCVIYVKTLNIKKWLLDTI